MPRNKDLKRVVRARMAKTGEAYTTARARVLAKPARPATRRAPDDTARTAATAPPEPGPAEYAALAGMSDATVKAKTGCDWAKWVKSLDYHGARDMTHGEIAKLVADKYKVSGWWAQSVTVGYERIRGLRARNQRRGGGFEANKSRTFAVPVETLYAAWSDARRRRRWLDEPAAKVKGATPPKYLRLEWPGTASVVVGFTAKGTGKSAVAVQHGGLPDREAADRLKAYWASRFDALGELLAR